jgi:hypothetical protein
MPGRTSRRCELNFDNFLNIRGMNMYNEKNVSTQGRVIGSFEHVDTYCGPIKKEKFLD